MNEHSTYHRIEEILDIPAEPGSYALQIILDKPVTWSSQSTGQPRLLQIGSLGEYPFPEGIYIYLGSARGPGGLRARLGRHIKGRIKCHWHIDTLRQVGQVGAYVYRVLEKVNLSTSLPETSDLSDECLWSQKLASIPGVVVPVPGFGASDCQNGCRAHLVYLEEERAWEEFVNLLL